MALNYETARMLAHQVLIDATVFNDKDFGAGSCPTCREATLSKAGSLARQLSLRDDYVVTTGTRPRVGDVDWPGSQRAVTLDWHETIIAAHSRHRKVAQE